MTADQDDELLLNVPSNTADNADTYVAFHRGTDTAVAWRAILLLKSRLRSPFWLAR